MNRVAPVRQHNAEFRWTHHHRGGLSSQPDQLWPDPRVGKAFGGTEQIHALIDDFYTRLEGDPLIAAVFPHFHSHAIKSFFAKVMTTGSGEPAGSAIHRFHLGTIVTPKTAALWLKHMRKAVKAAEISEPESTQFIAWLKPLAQRLVNTTDQELEESALVGACDGVVTQRGVERMQILKDALNGRLVRIEQALADEPNLVHYRNGEGQSLLWIATKRNRIKLVELLLQYNTDIHLPAREPKTTDLACSRVLQKGTGVMISPWALAQFRGNTRVAELLEGEGAIYDVFSAAMLGDIETLENAVAHQDDIIHAIDPAEDFHGIQPIHHAVAGGSFSAVEWLVNAGVEVRKHSHWLLTHAAAQNREDLVQLLLDYGADAHQSGVLGPLDEPVRPVADLLVKYGFDVNADSDFGAMLVRCCRADVSHHESTRARVLIKYGADVNRLSHGMSALHYAVRSGRLELIRLLLEEGADVKLLNKHQLPPLHELTKSRAKLEPVEVMRLLQEFGADLDAPTPGGESVLFHFARKGDVATVRWLLEQGVNAQRVNRRGKSILDQLRGKVGNARIVEILSR